MVDLDLAMDAYDKKIFSFWWGVTFFSKNFSYVECFHVN